MKWKYPFIFAGSGKTTPKIYNSSGYATFFSLVFSIAVIALAVLYLWIANTRLEGARTIKLDVEGTIKVHSIFSSLLFSLLTGTITHNSVQNQFAKGLIPQHDLFLDGRALKSRLKNVVFSLQDANGLISTRAPERQAFLRLIKGYLKDDTRREIFWNSFIDWEDKNDLKHLNGAEKFYYMNSKALNYHPRNRKVSYKKEFLLIRGMDEDIFEKLNPYFTIFPHSGFNPNTAPAPVLMARLNIDEKIAKQVVKLREGEEGPFKSDTGLLTLGISKPVKKGREVWYFPDPLVKINIMSMGKVDCKRRWTIFLKESKTAPFAVYEGEE